MRFFAWKRGVLAIVLFASMGIALSPNVAQAQFGGFLGGIANAIAVLVIGQFLLAGLFLTTAAATIAGIILGLATDPSFIRVPYTTGPIVETGWTVVRDFANMLIVFFLIIIGLATALRLGQYEAKKTLPRLIGVALLINFTPVITGFIVDTANIFMNFFLEGLAGIGLVTNLLTNLTNIVSGNSNIFDISLIFQLLAVMAFQVFAAIIFMLFAALFIVRRIAIWILVILSPIAFAAFILPRTRGLFNWWWNQFFQWSIIGIFAAFFLWLGDHIISLAARGEIAASVPSGGGVYGFVAGILNDTVPYSIALAMLLVGFFVALQTSGAMGATATKAFAMKGLKWGGATAGTAFWRRYGNKATGVATKMTSLASGLQQWGAEKRGAGRAVGIPATIAGMALRKGWGVTEAGARELSKQVNFRDYAAFDRAVKETAKMGDSRDVFATVNAELLKPVPNKNRILGLLTGVRNRGDADDIEDAFDPEKNGVLVGKEAKIGELIKLGRDRIGPHGERPLFKAFYGQIMTNPAKWGFNVGSDDLERDAEGKFAKDDAGRVKFTEGALSRKGSDAEYFERMKAKIPARMTPEDLKGDENAPSNYDPSTPAGAAFINSMLIERGAEFIGPMVRRREQAERTAITNHICSLDKDWLGKNAPDVLKWVSSTGAHNLGFTYIDPETGKGLTQDDAEKIIERYRVPGSADIRGLERRLDDIQKELVQERGRRPGGAVDLSPESLQKIRELEEDQTRTQEKLARSRASGASATPPSTTPPPPGEGGPERTPRGRPGATGSSKEGGQEKLPRGRPGSLA
ncbi:MAG: hypothetical protein HY458_01870 [Parcubacteria group bacterium]|nr:hypothetical protein [Parcubacteria group bacterium]